MPTHRLYVFLKLTSARGASCAVWSFPLWGAGSAVQLRPNSAGGVASFAQSAPSNPFMRPPGGATGFHEPGPSDPCRGRLRQRAPVGSPLCWAALVDWS